MYNSQYLSLLVDDYKIIIRLQLSDGPYIDLLSLLLKVEYVSIANMQKEDSGLVMLTLLCSLHVVADSDCDFYTESRSMCSIRQFVTRFPLVVLWFPMEETAECSNSSTVVKAFC